jgi:hypothetical protein
MPDVFEHQEQVVMPVTTTSLRDHAALVRKMDTIANEKRPAQTHEATARMLDRAADEIDRLNKWADSFSDAQLKERQLCEDTIRELIRPSPVTGG